MKSLLPHWLEHRLSKRVPIAIKLALAITILIVSGMSLLGFIILKNQKSIMSQQVESMGSTIAMQLADSSIEMVLADDTLSLQTLVNNLIDEDNILGAMIISDKGLPLAQSGTMADEKYIDMNLAQYMQPEQTVSFEEEGLKSGEVKKLVTFISPIHFNDLLAGHAVVTFSREAMAKSLHEAKQAIIITTIVMILVAILLAFIVSRHLSIPISNMVTACKAIGEGDFHYRLNETRNDEIGDLSLTFNQMADGMLQKSQVENVFSRYVSSSVAKKIMENLDEVELGGKYVNATVLFADIVGFTSLSENASPQDMTGLLNEYFSYASSIAQYYHGYIDKFIGDCIMMVFGIPEHDPDHIFHAISCAVMFQKLAARLNTVRQECNLLPVQFRIGINTGNMMAGNLGSRDRMEYTVIGDAVNLASRLSYIAGRDQIVIMDELYQQESIQRRVAAHPHKTIRVRGKKLPVSTYLVDDITSDYAQGMDTIIDNILTKYSAA